MLPSGSSLATGTNTEQSTSVRQFIRLVDRESPDVTLASALHNAAGLYVQLHECIATLDQTFAFRTIVGVGEREWGLKAEVVVIQKPVSEMGFGRKEVIQVVF